MKKGFCLKIGRVVLDVNLLVMPKEPKHKKESIEETGNRLVKKICDFIIKTVQTRSLDSGYQYYVTFERIEEHFGIPLSYEFLMVIEDALCEREEVNEVEVEDDSFSVTLFTDYAPNYDPEED